MKPSLTQRRGRCLPKKASCGWIPSFHIWRCGRRRCKAHPQQCSVIILKDSSKWDNLLNHTVTNRAAMWSDHKGISYLEVNSHIQSVGVVFHACAGPPNPKLLGDDGAATLEQRNLAIDHKHCYHLEGGKKGKNSHRNISWWQRGRKNNDWSQFLVLQRTWWRGCKGSGLRCASCRWRSHTKSEEHRK